MRGKEDNVNPKNRKYFEKIATITRQLFSTLDMRSTQTCARMCICACETRKRTNENPRSSRQTRGGEAGIDQDPPLVLRTLPVRAKRGSEAEPARR